MTQLENYSQSTQKQIEESARADHERTRLQSKLTEAQHERDQAKQELAELNVKHSSAIAQNQRLLEQLRIFEQESFEIQARIRRGVEIERENENMAKNVEAQRERERDMARQAEELKGQLRQRELEIERLLGKNDNVNYFQRNLEVELGQLRAESMRLNEALNACKTEEVRQEQRRNQMELEILDLKRNA